MGKRWVYFGVGSLVVIVEEGGMWSGSWVWKVGPVMWSSRVLEVGPKGVGGYWVSQAGREEDCHYWNDGFGRESWLILE